MPGPTLTFAFIVATLFGVVFHLFVGGDARRLALFLLAGWVGFGLGQVLGGVVGISVLPIGQLRMVAASVGALLALLVAFFLTRHRSGRPSSR